MSSSHSAGSYYRLHVFVCTHQRPAEDPRRGCGDQGSAAARDHLKRRAKDLGLDEVRINNAGCLGRCALGPVLVIYPDAAWYRFDSIADIDEILDRHLGRGQRVERLLLDGPVTPVLTA